MSQKYIEEEGIFGIKIQKRVRENPVPQKNCWKEECSIVEQYEFKEYVVREYAVAIESMKILRSKLRECYRQEGVNHLKNCRELAEKYGSMVDVWRATR
eukprot:TRINITY_DN109_c0_g1_i1.p2 TRINITY_DN109_c0_g1~~TRINITY_DN109_c0_g1_i1.p2  ORF type:complete len:116 (+),score=35.92 TRINITY_DN109_c0_g1_i1:53-349(+)